VIWIRDDILQHGSGVDQLVSLMLRIDAIADLEFGFVSSRKEHRRRSFPGKLTQRLPGVYWATLFGGAYIDLFGLEKLLSAPCDRIQRLTGSKVLLIARPHPLDSSLTEADTVADAIKVHLGSDAFASREHPYGKGLIPEFKLVRDKKTD
jgi:hypothetical protein